MTQQLIRQVLRAGSKDTRNYRYVARTANGADKRYQVIKRIALGALGTTAALTDKSDTNPHGWEIVYTEA